MAWLVGRGSGLGGSIVGAVVGTKLIGACGPEVVPGRVNAGTGGGSVRECSGVSRTIVTMVNTRRAATPRMVGTHGSTRTMPDFSCTYPHPGSQFVFPESGYRSTRY